MNPKTGELASPEDFQSEVVVGLQAPVKPEKPMINPRDLAIAEMAKRTQARREKDDKALKVDVLEEDGSITPAPDVPETVPLPELTAPEKTAAEPTSQNQTAEVTPTSAAPTAPIQEEERELIVDGKRIRVPISKILDAGTRTLQKESAADMRLAAATELLKSAQERQQPQQAVQQAQPSDNDAAIARAIQFGTEEEAKTAIATLRNAAPAITPQQIDAYVQQKLTRALPEHQAFSEANRWLKNEYPQIVSDPDIKFMFDMKEDQARKAGDRRPYSELYADLAGQMATKFNLKKAEGQTPAQPMTTQASDRLTRKANSPRPVTGASGRVEQTQAPKKAPTVQDYVQRQRELRGLQPLSKGI